MSVAFGFLVFLLGFAPLGGQTRDAGATAPQIQNERVSVWDYTWLQGAPSPIGRRDEDCVIVYLAPEPGRVVFQPKGQVAAVPAAAAGAAFRAKVVALHDHREPSRKNTSGLPNAFPRAGSKVILDNPRVTVWDYTFKDGSPSPMHFHDKDVVVTYIGAGALKSTTPEGQVQTNEYGFGDTRFNLGNRTHTELLTRGNLRIIAMELK
jgi:hypothetical protein